jgi:hypothetical protein
MGQIAVTFACGCRQDVDDADAVKDSVAPVCPTHGESRITRVSAPAPRFRGVAARGPLAVKE